MKGTVFYKMSGSGNDFIVLDGRVTDPADWPGRRIAELCDRRQGIGADGLVILTPEPPGRVRMTFFNCDGSPAAMCGNAALCSTRLSAYLELAPAEGMELATDSGTFPSRCVGSASLAELNLPAFDLPAEVPGIPRVQGEEALYLSTVGVPHLVVLVGDVEAVDLPRRGRELRFHPAVGEPGANVNFVSRGKSAGDSWPIRTYERGVEGETLACGTGAVAAGASIALSGRGGSPISFRTRSGLELGVNVRLNGRQAQDVWLSGEGRLVFHGVL